jgi:hypothetical protein
MKEIKTIMASKQLKYSYRYIELDENVLSEISTQKNTKKYLSIYYNITSSTNSRP